MWVGAAQVAGSDVPHAQEISAEFKEAQSAVDSSIVGSLPEECKAYLGARFTLRSADRPHLMKF